MLMVYIFLIMLAAVFGTMLIALVLDKGGE